MFDRDPQRNSFQFNHRILVYFAVDFKSSWMTTKLSGKKTFWPFNQKVQMELESWWGWEPRKLYRLSNPPISGRMCFKRCSDGHFTAIYHLEVKHEKDASGKTVEKQTLIFPVIINLTWFENSCRY